MKKKDVEIERKFLVKDASVLEAAVGTVLIQGYLPTSPARSVRIRRDGNGLGMLTVKGPRQGAERFEAECVIPAEIADQVLEECAHPLIIKTRYPVVAAGQVWVVDVFHEENEGLVLAEIEVEDPLAVVVPPAWCGAEVTNDGRYYNENLARRPYREWSHTA